MGHTAQSPIAGDIERQETPGPLCSGCSGSLYDYRHCAHINTVPIMSGTGLRLTVQMSHISVYHRSCDEVRGLELLELQSP